MVYIWLVVFGLAMGSFVNALVWRLYKKEDFVKGRSHCDRCGHQLSAWDLIPIFSWLRLGGRCRYCRQPIHWHNPLVEAATAGAFVLSYAFWPGEFSSIGEAVHFILWLGLLVGMMTIIVYDLKWMEVPNEVIYPMIFLSIIWAYAEAIFLDGGAAAMKELSLGLLVGSGLFLLLFFGSKGKWLGGGDVKLGFFFGSWLGPLYSLVALIVGFYAAFLVVVPMMLLKKVKRSQPIPFGPFLILGIFAATLWGQPLVDWYLKTFAG